MVLPLPSAAAAAVHAAAAVRGSSQRLGLLEVSESHNTPCRGPPCTCWESAGNLLCPAGEEGENDSLEGWRARGGEEEEFSGNMCQNTEWWKNVWKKQLFVCFVSDRYEIDCELLCKCQYGGCVCSDSGLFFCVQTHTVLTFILQWLRLKILVIVTLDSTISALKICFH